ncbi:hypothetical protein PBOI14_43630 [Pseudomonas sp. Boi14]|nr:hypothetical protein PBOI14_43630 [Pseudomonas sp. Boi14]
MLPQERFDTVPVVEDQLLALIPASHALASEAQLRLDQLCHDPFVLTEAGSAELVSRLFIGAGLRPNIRYRSTQLLSTLETVARGDALSIVAELSLPQAADPRYTNRPLEPAVRRQVGIAMLDRRQASPAALAFIQHAQRLYRR